MTGKSAVRNKKRPAVLARPVLGVVVGACLLITGCGAKQSPQAASSHTTNPATSADTATFPPLPPGADPRLEFEPVVEVPPTPPTTLGVADVIEGTGEVAATGDELTVNYVGVTYSDGEEFEASWHEQATYVFTLGAGTVIEGWDQGLVGMKVGGRRELAVPAAQAYGAAGRGAIPPDEPLVFLVDLLGVKHAP